MKRSPFAVFPTAKASSAYFRCIRPVSPRSKLRRQAKLVDPSSIISAPGRARKGPRYESDEWRVTCDELKQSSQILVISHMSLVTLLKSVDDLRRCIGA